MKNKLNRILLLSLVFAMGKPIFAEAKPLPDFNEEEMNWGSQRYKFTLIKNEEKTELGQPFETSSPGIRSY